MKIKKTLMNKVMPWVLATGLAAFASGCNFPETKVEYSDVLHEDARVVDVVYTPSRHGSGAGPTFHLNEEGGIGMGLAVTSVSIPEKYAVVFKCQHGKFISEGEDQRHKDLWGRLQEGEDVDVTYKEVYETTYQDIDKDGDKDIIKRELIKYDFLDAQPKGKEK